jgi:hypothetical protein
VEDTTIRDERERMPEISRFLGIVIALCRGHEKQLARSERRGDDAERECEGHRDALERNRRSLIEVDAHERSSARLRQTAHHVPEHDLDMAAGSAPEPFQDLLRALHESLHDPIDPGIRARHRGWLTFAARAQGSADRVDTSGPCVRLRSQG